MSAAIETEVRNFVARRHALLIDGRFRDAASGKTFPSFDPATGEVLAQIAEGDREDVEQAVRAARRAFESGPWPAMTASERGRLLWKLADLLEANADEFAALESLDNGKPMAVARAADVPLAVDNLRYFAGWATKIEGTTIPISVPGARGVDAARTGRCRRADHPLELPAADGGLEARSRARDRLHRRAEAGRADAAHRAAPRRTDLRSGLSRTAWSTSSRATAKRPAPRSRRIRTSTRSPSPAPPKWVA